MKNYNLLVLVVLISVVFNIICIVFFKFRVSGYFDRFESRVDSHINDSLFRFGSDTLSRIDSFLATNFVCSSTASTNSSIVSSPFYEVVERNFLYNYFIHDGRAFANIEGDYVCVGDPFPRGGIVTSISHDSIVVDNHYLFINRRNTTISSSAPLENHNNLKEVENVARSS